MGISSSPRKNARAAVRAEDAATATVNVLNTSYSPMGLSETATLTSEMMGEEQS